MDETTGEWRVFDSELNKLESPAPAAVIIEGVVAADFWLAVDVAAGSLFDFFGDELDSESFS